MNPIVRILISSLVVMLVWQVIVLLAQLPTFILPGPLDVVKALIKYHALILDHLSITALEVVVGFVLGAVFGILNALSIASSPWAQRTIFPVLVASQAVPVFAIAPLLTLWFGYGVTSKIIMTMLVIYFPVTSNFLDGLLRTPRPYLDMTGLMGARPRDVLLWVQVPLALPSLVSGLRLAAVFAPIGAVIGEWVGASGGLGYLMLYANGRVKTDLMFATILTLAIMAIIFLKLVHKMLHLLFPWISSTSNKMDIS